MRAAYLFSTSIRDNVGLGRPETTDEELERTLHLVGAWDWVRRLPDGWDMAACALIRDVFAAAGDASVLLIRHRPEGLELCDRVVELRHETIAL